MSDWEKYSIIIQSTKKEFNRQKRKGLNRNGNNPTTDKNQNRQKNANNISDRHNGKNKGFYQKRADAVISVVAAVISLFITPPSVKLFAGIEWHTLATLFMMLTVLEGFKSENIFRPLLKLAGGIGSMTALSLFLVFSVFFSSMLVTNDVSLIIFVPLTIMLFRAGDKEKYILPVITLENIAAIRGSLLMPFGSPHNLFIYGKSGVSAWEFVKFMFPIWILSAALLIVFVLLLYSRDIKQCTGINDLSFTGTWEKDRSFHRMAYVTIFAVVLWTIVSRSSLWPLVAAGVAVAVFFIDRRILVKTDYLLLLTFFCFFVFSSSISSNPAIAGLLAKAVDGHEYVCSILLSMVISNVPTSIVLLPYAKNLGALIYGVNTVGLCSIIGSLCSLINYRIYVREYPGQGGKFLKTFMLICLAFFALVAIPGYFLSLSGI